MGARQKDWARRERIRIIAILGGKCTDCHSQEQLELDCIEPRGHCHHSAEASVRISFYRKQMREGNLALRCRSCHAKKTCREMGYELPEEAAPFTSRSEVLKPTVILSTVNTVNNHTVTVLDGGNTPF
jgi:hypothetical protein